MKKGFMALVLCLAMVFSLAVPAFAATEETEGWTYDLTTITGESAIIHQEITPTEDGFIKTTVTATRPRYGLRTTEGEVTVTTTADLYSDAAGGYYGYVTLTTDFWFNSIKNTAGWSDADVEYGITDESLNVVELLANTPKGTTGTSFGTRWIKVTSNWYSENSFGMGTEGNIWNKITSKGVLSSSD